MFVRPIENNSMFSRLGKNTNNAKFVLTSSSSPKDWNYNKAKANENRESLTTQYKWSNYLIIS